MRRARQPSVRAALRPVKRAWRVTLALVLASMAATAGAATGAAAVDTRATGTQPMGARAAPITARELLEVRDLSGLRVSPDGRLAVVSVQRPSAARNTVDLTWWVVPLDGSAVPYPIADGGDPIWIDQAPLQDEWPQWSPDSRWVYYRALVDGAVQLWRSRSDGGYAERLVGDPADVESFEVDPADGRVFYTVGATRDAILRAEAEEYRSGVVLGEDTVLANRLVNNLPYNGRMATVRLLRNAAEPTLRVLDLASGETRPASEEERQAHEELTAPAVRIAAEPLARHAVASPVDAAVAYLSRVDDPLPADSPAEMLANRLSTRATYQVTRAESAEARRPVVCEAAECTGLGAQIGHVAWRPDGSEVLFAAMGPDGSTETTLYGWNVSSGEVRPIFSGGFFGDSRMSIGNCPVAGDDMICVTAAAAEAPRLERIALATGARSVLFDPNPHLRGRFGPVESLHWQDPEGRRFHGYLLLPREQPDGRLPLIITSYACAGFLRGGVGDEYPEHVFVASGFAVLCYNHDTRDPARTIQRGPDGEWLPVPGMEMATRALEAAVDLLDARGLVDPERVGLSGLSYGARMTLYAISHSPRFVAASTSGTSDLDPFDDYLIELDGPMGTTIRGLEGLSTRWDDARNVRQRVSPALNAARIAAPLLIQVADNEYGGDTQELMAYMSRARKPFEVVVFPDEGHQKWQPMHKLAAYERNVDWFRFWLQGHEDPVPAKAEQYRRWRAMRAEAGP